MKPRIIVCGLGQTGYKIYTLLKQQGLGVVGISTHPVVGGAVESSPNPRPNLRSDAISTSIPDINIPDIIVGDLRSASTLLAAGIRDAQTLVLATSDDALNLAVLVQARVLNPHIRIVNRLYNTSLGDRLDQTLAHHTSMSVSALAAPVFAFAALGNLAIGQLKLFNQTWPMHEEHIEADHPWRGRLLQELWDDRARMLIYYLPADHTTDLVSAMLRGERLQVGDRLIVATQPSVRLTQRSLKATVLKFLASLKRLHSHGRSAIVVLLLLFCTIFIATLTYICINFNTSVEDALYFSVGMITGAGGNERIAEQAPPSIKVFTAIMMLVGAGVIGVGYALLNDFVLGTRFHQLWDAAQVPQAGHYIVCGLGGVGMQIAKQLRDRGHEVVIIERDPHCRFLSTAHQLKLPVIQGDANLADVLQSAHIDAAQALLAVTSDDTANLEIALTAKGLSPRLAVIVRNQDPSFSHMAQQVFEFEAVLSPTELAAPSFAAVAFGGRILGNGLTGNHLWVALAALITENHPFCGQPVKEIAIQGDLVPLYLETSHQTIHGWPLLDASLSVGDILYLTVPAHRLDELWRSVQLPVIG
ncbi:NAD-binding protein [Alkalinema sp. FACHB-956]|uniref:potassium channel family protein n=1 Tax=Alkalinema sp. FACHB-956 TaxID=2692768 RepID=UPI00168A3705|nr:NAD-binding protein [Alkalinema sp. FACHB-956]MBD2329457.1 NAD-binding protein [Alkalinema sp. FACHB-956]